MNTDDLKRRAGITEDKGSIAKYNVKVKIDGTVMWTCVFAENVERARKIANHLYDSVVGRPTKAD